MGISEKRRHKDYARYAAHCLNLMASPENQDDWDISREMAAEWLKLADAILFQLKSET